MIVCKGNYFVYMVLQVRIMIDKFGIAAIRHGWYDANLITDHVLDGYKKVC